MDEINKVFNIVGVEGDSHCLLHSLLYGLSNIKGYEYINKIINKYLKNNPNKSDIKLVKKKTIEYDKRTITLLRQIIYKNMIKNNNTEDPSDELKKKEYLTDVHIGVLSELFDVCIVVYSPFNPFIKTQRITGINKYIFKNDDDKKCDKKKIFILSNYAGKDQIGNHYDSLILKKKSGIRSN